MVALTSFQSGVSGEISAFGIDVIPSAHTGKNMAYDVQLADKIRAHVKQFPGLKIEEKKMFGGLAFIINGKMCVNVSGKNLMCRFDPDLTQDLTATMGFLPVTMKGRDYKGFCYVQPAGFKSKKDFSFWMDLCLDFNKRITSPGVVSPRNQRTRKPPTI